MRSHRLAILAGLALLFLDNMTWAPEPPPEPEPTVQEDPGPPWHVLHGAWQMQVYRDIQRDHLISKMNIDEDLATEIVTLVDRESMRYGLSSSRMLALIIVESWGDPDAVSHAGAIGLMQVLPGTGRFIARRMDHEWNGPRDLKDVETNISFGTWYYQHLLRQFRGDEHAALAAYNWGPEHIRLRIKNAERLPQVYPGKVYLAEEELRKELWNEYRVRYWRGLDSFVNRARECVHAGGSYAECGLEWYPELDEQSLSPEDGQPFHSMSASVR